ncbi:hypothetical protein BJV82DRAFT_585147 [Fennellomyces sp. T-0311]|nr:hypothetical protein BJV82DRAFT_585147 [Fennellomyces sp. T-0311]
MKTRRQRQAEDADDLLVQNVINDLNGLETTRFLDPLPVEIIVVIASHLDQRDCLACMAVCRSWYLTAPQYLQSVWKEVRITYNTFPICDPQWVRCVQHYTKSIVVDDYEYNKQYFIMQKLIDCQLREINSLEVLVPTGISVARRKTFLSSIKQLGGGNLTRLTFNDLYDDMGLYDTLCTYPNLVKFVSHGDTIPEKLETKHQAILPQFIHLTHLYLDRPINMKLQLEPILKSSPNLQYLAYGKRCFGAIITINQNVFPANSLDDVFLWCPKLIWLEANGGSLPLYHRTVSQDLIRRSEGDFSGLRSFTTSENNGYTQKQVEPHLFHNAATLEFLANGYTAGWSSFIGQLHFPLLRMLLLYSFEKSSVPWDVVVPECPILEHLELDGKREGRLDLSVLKKLKQLKQLHLSGLTLSYNRSSLKNLMTHWSKISDINLYCVGPIDDILLEAITHLSTLEQLAITFPFEDRDYTDNGLLQFITQLSKTSIRSLHLCKTAYLPGGFISAVGDLSALHTLDVETASFNIRDLPVPEVDASALLNLLETRCLKHVSLKTVNIIGSDNEFPYTFFQKKLQGYNISIWSVYGQPEMMQASFIRR